MRVILLPLATLACASAAESFAVLGVPACDQVTIDHKGLPVTVGLAHLAVPEDPAAQQALRDRLALLVQGQRVEVLYTADFGTDPRGSARVQLVTAKGNVNETLVANGLAAYQQTKPDSGFEGVIRRAQEKAQRGKMGLWAEGAVQAAAAKPAAAPKPAPAVRAPAVKGPFCSEVDSSFYYATGSREVAAVNPQRLLYYPDEATAQKAGKRAKAAPVAMAAGADEATADQLYQQGGEIAGRCAGSPPSEERDREYEKAYQLLTRALQIYTPLAEKRPDDAKLGEKLRLCMQARYTTVKMRRFH